MICVNGSSVVSVWKGLPPTFPLSTADRSVLMDFSRVDWSGTLAMPFRPPRKPARAGHGLPGQGRRLYAASPVRHGRPISGRCGRKRTRRRQLDLPRRARRTQSGSACESRTGSVRAKRARRARFDFANEPDCVTNRAVRATRDPQTTPSPSRAFRALPGTAANGSPLPISAPSTCLGGFGFAPKGLGTRSPQCVAGHADCSLHRSTRFGRPGGSTGSRSTDAPRPRSKRENRRCFMERIEATDRRAERNVNFDSAAWRRSLRWPSQSRAPKPMRLVSVRRRRGPSSRHARVN